MRLSFLLFALFAVLACSQEEMLQKFSSPEEQALARAYIDQLRLRKFDEIEKVLDPSIRTPGTRDTLTKMAALLPGEEPASVRLVGAHRFQGPDGTTVNTTFEFGYPQKWFLTNVAVREKDGAKTIVGFNVTPIAASLEAQNKFSLEGKTAAHYAVLAALVAALLTTLYALIACVRTPSFKRKWLWVAFILVGFGRLALNWATGEWTVAPLYFQLFSASAFAPIYGPWTIGVSIPVGAIAFLAYKRPSLARPSEAH